MAAPIPKKKSKIESSSKANNDKDSDSVSDTAAVIDNIPHLRSDKKPSPKEINTKEGSPISSVEESDGTDRDESNEDSTEANSDNKSSTLLKNTAVSIHKAAAKQVQTAVALTSSLLKMAEEKEIFHGKNLFHHQNKPSPNTSFAEQDPKRKHPTTFLKPFLKSQRAAIKKKNFQQRSLPT